MVPSGCGPEAAAPRLHWGRMTMSAYNIVRMRVKPEFVGEFLAFSRARPLDMAGMTSLAVVKTGERVFCIVGEGTGMDAPAAARPAMTASLDEHRHKLDDLGEGLGVTD